MTNKYLYSPVHRMVSLSRTAKRLVMLSADALAAPLLLWLAYGLRLNTATPEVADLWLLVAAPLVLLPALYVLGFYRSIVRYLGAEVAWSILAGVTLSVVLLAAASYMASASTPRSVFIIFWAVLVLYLGGSRFMMRRFLYHVLGNRIDREAVAVFGAGGAGAQLVSGLLSTAELHPLMIVDDAVGKQGTLLCGVPVVGRRALEKAVERGAIRTVLLALPSESRATRMAVVRWLETLNVHVQTVPSFADIASGKARLEEIKEVAIEDLLGRDAVPPRADLLTRCISGKHVLVTGAGGSIGSELCRQILKLSPSKLLLLDQSEFGLYAIEKELQAFAGNRSKDIEIEAVLGSVVNRGLMERLCREHRVDTVYHAAAYKHVPIVEANPSAGVRNNLSLIHI